MSSRSIAGQIALCVRLLNEVHAPAMRCDRPFAHATGEHFDATHSPANQTMSSRSELLSTVSLTCLQ